MPIPKYIVNLDLPPRNRWTHITNEYKDKIPNVLVSAEEILGSFFCKYVVEPWIKLTATVMPGKFDYKDEIMGIANDSGISFGKLVMLQIAYEFFAGCTSIVVNGNKGSPIHIRTLDWETTPELKDITIEVDFVKNGNVVFSAITWAGYVGVLTGMRPGCFSVSINYRQSKFGTYHRNMAFLLNIKRFFNGHWLIGNLVRDTLCMETNFQTAVERFKTEELVAPTYIIVCGVNVNEGAVLTRNRDTKIIHDYSQSDYDIGNFSGNIFEFLSCGRSLIQANMDTYRDNNSEHDWQDIGESRERREIVLSTLVKKYNQKQKRSRSKTRIEYTFSEKELWDVVKKVTYKDETIYITCMNPSTSTMIVKM